MNIGKEQKKIPYTFLFFFFETGFYVTQVATYPWAQVILLASVS